MYFVRFRGRDGRRLERSTGAAKKPDAAAAARLVATLKAHGNRPATIKGYVETLNRLRVMFPECPGPGAVTGRHAAEFKTRYGGGTYTRRRRLRAGEAAPAYARAGKSLDTRLRTLKAVFEHLRKMTPPVVGANPFAGITLPKLDRDVKYVTRADVVDVFGWFEARYPGWAMPRLFFRVKALTASRLEDLCSLPSAAVAGGGILFPAGTAKHRAERFAKLPDDVYAELAAYRGPTWAWERYPAELLAANRKLGVACGRLNPEFSPRRLYLWVAQVMQLYQKQTGRDFSSHDFRKAAFTRAAEKDLHPKKVATGFGVTPETMLRYYTAVDQRKASEEVSAELAADLDPTKG